MRTTISSELERILSEYVHAAAHLLQAEVGAGSEVQLELDAQRGRAHTPFYTYRPLTSRFIAERELQLQRLPEHETALGAMQGFDGLDRYLSGQRGEARMAQAYDRRDVDRRDVFPQMGPGVGVEPGPGHMPAPGQQRELGQHVPAHARASTWALACTALAALLNDVFAEQTDFELRPGRLEAALARLERAELRSSPGTLTLVASLHGMTIASPEINLTRGLTIAMPSTLRWVPAQALAGIADDEAGHLLVALTCEEAIDGREVLRDLLRALRLFGDGRVTLGPLAWVRADGHDTWSTIALGSGGRPHGMLVVSPEQEDELRAFCNLVSRRAPHGNELAWALRRFELGCERVAPYEGLSDHLLALRALVEPEGPSSGLLAGRVAALCATPERRVRLTERMTRAQRLERAVIAGTATESAAGLAVAREVSDHLRALLRDVICGHLPADLTHLADELLAGASQEEQETAQEEPDPSRGEPDPSRGEPDPSRVEPDSSRGKPESLRGGPESVKEPIGQPGEAREVADVMA